MTLENCLLDELLQRRVEDEGLVASAPAIARALACTAEDQESRRFLARVFAMLSKELRDGAVH